MKSKSLSLRGTALVTVLIFLMVEVCSPASSLAGPDGFMQANVGARRAVPVQNEINLRSSSFNLSIPEELGRIESLHSGKGPSTGSLQRAGGQAGQVPTLVHIQTAHGNYEAQKKIEGILKHLKESYGFDLVLLEGTAAKLKPELLNLFPSRKQTTKKILDRLMREAYVKGAEMFLAEDGESEGYGIEELDTYAENGKAFQEVLTEQQKTGEFLRDMDMQIERLTTPFLNKKLKSFIKQYEKSEEGLYPFKDWIVFLKNKAKEYLEIDLEDSAYQIDWPMLLRVFTIEKFEKELDLGKYAREREAFMKAAKRFQRHKAQDTGHKRIEELLANPTSTHQLDDPATYRLFENMVESLPRDFDYSAYPNVKLVIGRMILQSELKSRALIEELQEIQNKIFEKLSESEEEKKVLALLKDYWLLEKLFKLELTPDEYANVGAHGRAPLRTIKPSVVIQRFLELNKDNRVKDIEFKHVEEIDRLFEASLKFYELVKKRDDEMIRNVEKILKSNVGATRRVARTVDGGMAIPPKAVIVTGGFHVMPFREHFQSEDYNYALILPNITTTDGKEAYVESVFATQQATFETVPFGSLLEADLEDHNVDPRKVRVKFLGASHAELSAEGETLTGLNELLVESPMLGDFEIKRVLGPNDEPGFGILLNGKKYAWVPEREERQVITRMQRTLDSTHAQFAQLSETRSISSHQNTDKQIEQARIQSLLRENGIDPEDIRVLLYPAAGSYDGNLVKVFHRDLAPNLNHIHYNSTSYQFGDAPQMLAEEMKKGLDGESFTFETSAESYMDAEINLPNEGVRIWVDKGPGENGDLRKNPLFYLTALKKGYLRPGKDLVLTFDGGVEAPYLWQNTIAEKVILPSLYPEYHISIAIPTIEDYEALQARASDSSKEFRTWIRERFRETVSSSETRMDLESGKSITVEITGEFKLTVIQNTTSIATWMLQGNASSFKYGHLKEAAGAYDFEPYVAGEKINLAGLDFSSDGKTINLTNKTGTLLNVKLQGWVKEVASPKASEFDADENVIDEKVYVFKISGDYSLGVKRKKETGEAYWDVWGDSKKIGVDYYPDGFVDDQAMHGMPHDAPTEIKSNGITVNSNGKTLIVMGKEALEFYDPANSKSGDLPKNLERPTKKTKQSESAFLPGKLPAVAEKPVLQDDAIWKTVALKVKGSFMLTVSEHQNDKKNWSLMGDVTKIGTLLADASGQVETKWKALNQKFFLTEDIQVHFDGEILLISHKFPKEPHFDFSDNIERLSPGAIPAQPKSAAASDSDTGSKQVKAVAFQSIDIVGKVIEISIVGDELWIIITGGD